MPIHLATRMPTGRRDRVGVSIPLTEALYLQTQPSRTRVTVTNIRQDPYLRIVSTFIPDFFNAYRSNESVEVGAFKQCRIDPLPFDLPFVISEAKAHVSSRDVGSFVVQHRGYRERIGKRNVIIFKDLSLDGLRSIASSSLLREDTSAGSNAISINECKVLLTILRICNASFQTLYNAHSASLNGDRASTVFVDDAPEDDEDMNIDAGTEGSTSTSAPPPTKPTILSAMVVTSISTQHTFEPVQLDSPIHNQGVFFPFDRSLECADLQAVPDFISTRLQGFLAETEEDRSVILGQIRAAWPSISRTMTGYQLSHFVKTLDFAVVSSSRPLPVFRGGRYLGACLLSPCILVNDSYDLHHPLSAEDLVEEIEKADVKEFSRKRILQILARAGVRAGLNEEQLGHLDEWDSVRLLSRHVSTLPLTEEEKVDLVALASGLHRTIDFFLPSPDYIIRAVGYIADPTITIEGNLPMWHEALFTSSRLEEVLSLFGERVPCFDVQSAPAIRLSRGALPPDANFVARPLPYRDAIANWEGWTSSKVLHNGPKAKSASLHDRAFDGADRGRVWRELMTLVPEDGIADPVERVAAPLKKRKAATSIFDFI